MAVALAVRLYRLDARSLWLDEILTSQPAHLSGPGDVVSWSRAALNQMPFFYMFTWLLGHWGDGAVMLRLPAAIAGTLLVPAVFLLGRSLFGTFVGLVASLMTTVLPFSVWYSQEARSYTLLMLLVTLQMYFAYAAVKRGHALNWLGLATFTILSLYTHYVALFATAAVVVYVGFFLIAELLKGRSTSFSAIAAAIVIVAVAAVAGVGLELFKSEYTNLSIFLRAHRVLALVSASALVAVVSGAAIALIRRRPVGPINQMAQAVLAGLIVAVAYAPWLTSLRTLLGRPDQSVGQIHLDHSPSISDLALTLNGLSLTGFVLVFVCLGLGVIAAWAFRGHAAESGLILSWVGLPLLLFFSAAGLAIVAVDVRYVAFLYPATMIAIGVGVKAAAMGLEALAFRLRRPSSFQRTWAVPALGVAVGGLLLVQVLPALAASYGQPKDDYRTVARHISATSPPGSVVITVGNYSDWTVITLGYYFRELGSRIAVVDAREADSALAQRLTSGSGKVWGVVIFPSNDQLALLASPGPEKVDFVDVTGHIRLVRAVDDGLSPIDQARTLLRWELPLEPGLTDPLARIGGSHTQ